jgi:hypothetical protein
MIKIHIRGQSASYSRIRLTFSIPEETAPTSGTHGIHISYGLLPETHEQGDRARIISQLATTTPEKTCSSPRASTAHKVSQLEINDIDDRCTKYQVLPRCDSGDRNSRALSWLVSETCPNNPPISYYCILNWSTEVLCYIGVWSDSRSQMLQSGFDGRRCVSSRVFLDLTQSQKQQRFFFNLNS